MVRIVVITGFSGSGKSTAIKALEDEGFYCVDNLPVALLPKFVELCEDSGEISRIAIGVDVRGGDFLKSFPEVLGRLNSEGNDVEIIFLESSDEVLLSRFSETRRIHPLAPSGQLTEGILKEKNVLSPLRREANKIIDSSTFNVHQLKRVISDYVREDAFSKKMVFSIVSFGFKYGPLYEADIIMDVRFLPNPNFVNELKALTGENERVADFVMKSDKAEGFMERFSGMINYLLPEYIAEGKSYLTIGLGCTGGRHRSVAIAEGLASRLVDGEYKLRVLHRDKERV